MPRQRPCSISAEEQKIAAARRCVGLLQADLSATYDRISGQGSPEQNALQRDSGRGLTIYASEAENTTPIDNPNDGPIKKAYHQQLAALFFQKFYTQWNAMCDGSGWIPVAPADAEEYLYLKENKLVIVYPTLSFKLLQNNVLLQWPVSLTMRFILNANNNQFELNAIETDPAADYFINALMTTDMCALQPVQALLEIVYLYDSNAQHAVRLEAVHHFKQALHQLEHSMRQAFYATAGQFLATHFDSQSFEVKSSCGDCVSLFRRRDTHRQYVENFLVTAQKPQIVNIAPVRELATPVA